MAYDAFLKLDGIQGESRDAFHKGWCDVLSFHWGIAHPSVANQGGGGTAAGRTQTSEDLTIVKHADSSSPLLLSSCCSGEHIKTATLECRKAGDDNRSSFFLKFELRDVLVSSLRMGGTGASDEVPLEELSLNFSTITETFRSVNPTGDNSQDVKGMCNLSRGAGF